jgi:aromatic ring-cleaving dioxygenase
MEFHAHIYYSPRNRVSAERLRERFKALTPAGLKVGPLEDRLRGPHPGPMFELRFDQRLFGEIAQWLLFHRGPHPVLIHAVTGNDPHDHEHYAMWLGEPQKLDYERLDPPVPGWTAVQPSH